MGIPALYITDESVIQVNIGVNSSLTITAIAEYAMSKINDKDGFQKAEVPKQLLYLEEEWKKKNYS